VGLVGKAAFRRDLAQAIGAMGHAQPRCAGASLSAKDLRSHAVYGRETSRDGLLCEVVRVCPLANGQAAILRQRLGQEIRPVILHAAWAGLVLMKSILQQLRGVSRIFFRCFRQVVQFVAQAIEAAGGFPV